MVRPVRPADERRGAPAWTAARATADPDRYLLGLLGAARAGTIRARVRIWERLCRWLVLQRAVSWPTSPAHVVEYLWAQMAEAPSPTFPRSLLAAVSWVESRAGGDPGARLSLDDGLKRTVDKATAEAEEGAKEQLRAPRFPVVVLGALEKLVLDTKVRVVLRVVAWARLVKVFGALRADDLQRIVPDDVELTEAGLVARLRRTKTSGAGKKIKDLRLFVPAVAWIRGEGWLEVGYRLWREVAPGRRDHFLPRPLPDLTGFGVKVAEPADLAAMNAQVLEALVVPGSGGTPLLAKILVPVWSGHSERATLASCLAALGVPRADRDPLGRWCAEGSDVYVRSYRALVKRLVLLFVVGARAPGGFADLDEEDAILDTRRLFEKRGVDMVAGGAAVRQLVVYSKAFFADAPVVVDPLEVKAVEGEVPAAEPDSDEGETAEFVVALACRGSRATLHRRDGCWRARRLAFRSFEFVAGPELPGEEFYNSKCKDCWRGSRRVSAISSGSSGASSTSSAATVGS